MKNSTTTPLKVPILTCLLVYILGITNILNAQIIYTDLEPDFTSNSHNTFFELDINNDGIINFNLESTTGPSVILGINNIENSSVKSEQRGWINLVQVLDSRSSVKTTETPFSWTQWPGLLHIGCYNFSPCTDTNWAGQTDKYIGISFKIENNWHYGWIRVDVTNNSTWTIKDYAYNATPNEDLLTGVTSFLSTDDLYSLKDIKLITSNNKITAVNLIENTSFSIYTITGSLLLTTIISPTENTITNTSFASGIYIVKLKNMSSGHSSERKIILG